MSTHKLSDKKPRNPNAVILRITQLVLLRSLPPLSQIPSQSLLFQINYICRIYDIIWRIDCHNIQIDILCCEELMFAKYTMKKTAYE